MSKQGQGEMLIALAAAGAVGFMLWQRHNNSESGSEALQEKNAEAMRKKREEGMAKALERKRARRKLLEQIRKNEPVLKAVQEQEARERTQRAKKARKENERARKKVVEQWEGVMPILIAPTGPVLHDRGEQQPKKPAKRPKPQPNKLHGGSRRLEQDRRKAQRQAAQKQAAKDWHVKPEEVTVIQDTKGNVIDALPTPIIKRKAWY